MEGIAEEDKTDRVETHEVHTHFLTVEVTTYLSVGFGLLTVFVFFSPKLLFIVHIVISGPSCESITG